MKNDLDRLPCAMALHGPWSIQHKRERSCLFVVGISLNPITKLEANDD